MINRKVTPSESGKRLHRFLRNLLPNVPLGQIYKMIDSGKVRVNGKRKKQDYELAAGDELAIYMEEEQYKEASIGQQKTKYVGVNADVHVVYEDDQLLVALKPAGMLTHPDQTDQRDTLINRVHAYLYRKGELDSPMFMPATANRLDRNTSGLVLVGKTAGMLHQLNQWIQKHELKKYYVTIVEGRLEGEGELTDELVRDEKRNRTRVASAANAADEKRLSATTRYRALSQGDGYSLVEIELVSGRTHQIRTHFQSIGHPLLGDVKYGGKIYAGINHQLLHAWRVVLPDGREFRAPAPPILKRTADKLRLEGI
ncbi:23S rRNA pseudouridine955/2504/2580 synthase [Cohnella sp. OV330]|uniref:RluA family pseudouridine synthase n=1 Tax=Cohnella sp. OV330 TaxID=1855288 RepID=UPI0008EB3AAE|nr:RluA family pseudouridine synthase [Cohnella sp. OV330]SFB20994.1 23S rRNA pseudouridine955/2504/2580 synthase [Cohnella sp. OV330]